MPYCVIVLPVLLTSECKSAAAQYTNIAIIWHLRKVFQENKLRLYYHSVSLYLLLMSELKAF